VSLLPWYYRWAGFAVACAALFGYGYLKGSLHEEAKFQAFVAQTRAEGEAAQKSALERIAADKLRKENADHENALSLAALRADNDRLRSARTHSSYLPAATAGAKDPDRACFSRTDLERAIQRLDARVSGIVDQGDVARVNLDTGKKWAAP
jgi:hypothetical protein